MSEYAINQYLGVAEKIVQYGGTKKETAIRTAFFNLLNEYAKIKGLLVVAEVTIKGTIGKNVTPDGTLKDSLRQDWGYWESKDESDILDDEIKKKFDKGYPKENILFEDTKTAVLIQNGNEILRVPMNNPEALNKLLIQFINFERPEVKNFRKAIELFKQDIPKVTETLRGIIIAQEKTNPKFVKESESFLKLCHDSINPEITNEDVREMIIQHILTEDIFNTIFDETQFHRENNIAHELQKVIETFFTGNIRRVALSTVQHYYQTINAAAAGIADHHEKQKFLKVVYETFYKSYNPKAADKLGVVYTPNEIVRFMIESTDKLLNKFFNKSIEDNGVEILDPATGTGTFICDIIDYIKKDKIEYKYQEEIHANEVAILPYYISNLNIEYTYKQKTGIYKEFESLCFVDTLDNLSFHFRGKQGNLFEPFTEENSKRIKRQNDKRISVIIGNPPYNANQVSENDFNKNRDYPGIDKRIKETFIEYSKAQKSKVYDPYARFYRWAMDRINKNGIIAFITNRSFIESKTFDGFRKCISLEFDFAYIIDLGGDIRSKMGQKLNIGNVFGIITGVAIMYLVKKVSKENKSVCNIQYFAIQDTLNKEEKLNWLSQTNFEEINFSRITPDERNNWLNIVENDYDSLIPLIDKRNKLSDRLLYNKILFRYYSNGCVTNRDEWVYDFEESNLKNKIKYFLEEYNTTLNKWQIENLRKKHYNKKPNEILNESIDFVAKCKPTIKWSGRLFRDKLTKNRTTKFAKTNIRYCMYRPFSKRFLYYDYIPIDIQGQLQTFLPEFNSVNKIINFSASSKNFHSLATDALVDLHLTIDTLCIPLYYYDKSGDRQENITDWGLNQFRKHYKNQSITKSKIFNYCYAIFYYPNYKIKYESNLTQDYPKIPFYKNFNKWAAWGEYLMDLHINYENQKPFNLKRIKTGIKESPKSKLKANKELGILILDENTSISGIPSEAWEYKLGNRSALEWILDQYKESKSQDITIAEKFNTYKFADYKEHVIDLLKRVCNVSVETMKIIEEMKKEIE